MGQTLTSLTGLLLLTALLDARPALARPPASEARAQRFGPIAGTPAPGSCEVSSPHVIARAPGLRPAAQAVRDGATDQAISHLKDLLDRAPGSPDAGHACVMLGTLLQQQARYAEAESTLAACHVPTTLTDMHAMALGESLRHLRLPERALPLFKQVAAMHRSPEAPRATFRVGDALFEAGRWRKARRQLEAALTRYPEYPEAAMVRYRLGRCELALKRPRIALAAYAALVRDEAPGNAARILAEEGLLELANRGIKPRPLTFDRRFEQAMRLRKARRWPEALAAFQALQGQAHGRNRAIIQRRIARALEALDRYDEALIALKAAQHLGGASSEIVNAKVRILRLQGRTAEAVRIERARAGGSKRVKALAAARVYYEDGHYKEAYTLYRKYLRTRHNTPNKWRIAWLAYRSGHYPEALKGFDALLSSRRIRKNKVAYWRARTLQRMDRTEEATAAFLALSTANPVGYYGIQAANRLLDLGQTDQYATATGALSTALPTADDLAYPGGSIAWRDADGSEMPLSAPAPPQPERLLTAARIYGDAFPELMRAYDRHRMGFDEAARIELRSARAEYQRAKRGSPRRLADRPATLWFDGKRRKRGIWGSRLHKKLGLNKWQRKKRATRIKAMKKTDRAFGPLITDLLVALGDPYWTRKRAYQRAWRTLRGTPTDDTRNIFKAAYPLAFERTLRQETARYNLSPFLLSALTRVESAFNELAVSYAGARGLMQVMPNTGRLIAQRRGDVDFSPALLLDPRWSIAYGSWYIDQLLKKFNGQEPLAIISYNCGPHRVDKWVKKRGAQSDMDEFIEEVPYGQSRRYVKSILRYIAIYRRTWMDRPDLYVGQTIDTDFKRNINW